MATINEINWYPGHMQKAIRRIQEKIKQCDGVIEIGDARAPISSFPDYLDKVTEGKTKVYVFSKIDLADPVAFSRQIEMLKAKGITPLAYDLRDQKAGKELLKFLSSVKTKQDEKYLRMGFPLPIKRFMVLGIPNVGKSTLLNALSGKKKAAVENRPGKTRTETMIHVTDKIFVFDTPGILEPNYEDKNIIAKLALLGSVKAEILPKIALSDYLLDYIKEKYPDNFRERYQIELEGSDEEIFEELARKRQFMANDGQMDTDRARTMFMTEFKAGTIGRISLDD